MTDLVTVAGIPLPEPSAYTVYRHTCPNGKIYVGITSKKPEERWKNGASYKRSVFGRAIQKYGWENIKHEILYSGVSQRVAEQLEVLIISALRSNDRKHGYNIANGGQGATAMSQETRDKIRQAHLGKSNGRSGKNHPLYGKCGKDNPKSQLVNQYSLNGQLIAQYYGTCDAERKTGVNCSAINMCCNGKRKTAGGYIWLWEKDAALQLTDRLNNSANKKLVPVVCVETGEVFVSASDAARKFRTQPASIISCCKQRLRTTAGHSFEYAEAS